MDNNKSKLQFITLTGNRGMKFIVDSDSERSNTPYNERASRRNSAKNRREMSANGAKIMSSGTMPVQH